MQPTILCVGNVDTSPGSPELAHISVVVPGQLGHLVAALDGFFLETSF